MAEPLKVPTIEKGTRFAHLLRNASRNTFNSHIETEPDVLKQITDGPWNKFVTFPSSKDFPISNTIMRPEIFLINLGQSGAEVKMSEEALSNDQLGRFQRPVFYFSTLKGFTLRVINGMFNKHAMKMTEMASRGFGFDDFLDRAEYQDAMQKLATPIVRSKYDTETFGIRIFDDCIASADSIYGYLYDQLHDRAGEEKIRRGVRIDVITATPQAILFLKRFAEVMGFPLEINVSQLAPGLNEKNYIVYPDEFLKSGVLPEDLVKTLKGYRNKDGNIYVVGDMGNAQKGLSEQEVNSLQSLIFGGPPNLRFNNERTDPHGNHPKRRKKVDTRIIEQYATDELPQADLVYFARGGYLPFQLDKTYGNGALKRANIIVLRASRKELNGQYGVAFGPEKE
jgi:hypothetical protein